jgi:hypothetical protein
VRQPVEERILLGKVDRAVKREDAHHRPQPEPLRPRAARREQDGRGRAESPRLEVVFRHPETREARRFGRLGEPEDLGVPISATPLRFGELVDDRERGELHGRPTGAG